MTRRLLHVRARLGAGSGFGHDSDAMTDPRHAPGTVGMRAGYRSERSFRVGNPNSRSGAPVRWGLPNRNFKNSAWDELPGGQILRKVEERFVEATFDALFDDGWTVTVSILDVQS